MKRLRKKMCIATVLAGLLAIGCSKEDEPVNLSATLASENNFVEVAEGDYAYINLSLEKPLSKDLLLEGSFSTKNILAYGHKEDYSTAFAYSSDNGKKWQKEPTPHRVRFAKGTTQLKIRVATVDDDILESTEQFDIAFSPVNTGQFSLKNKLRNTRISVTDNERNEYFRDDSFMTFELGDGYNGYTLVGITPSITTPFQKECVEGLYKKPLEDALELFKLLPNDIKVKTYSFDVAQSKQNIAASATNNSKQGLDEWGVSMDLRMAYYKYDDKMFGRDGFTKYKRIDYNSDGNYGNVLVHEFAHILTLNQATQFDQLIKKGACSNYYSSNDGCAKPNAYMNLFHEKFYKNEITNQPTHVTEYAASNMDEDMAETIALYMSQETIPPATSKSSGALQKLNFIHSTDLAKLKPKIRKLLTLTYNKPDGREILSRYLGKGGKKSCLGH